mmetsp:Transcript_60951/g.170487  ORF Transcript_60951/g.170487 Transcript_60951/m.170487 type:complete len:240 (+) Transcript_60951:784-1503(+)
MPGSLPVGESSSSSLSSFSAPLSLSSPLSSSSPLSLSTTMSQSPPSAPRPSWTVRSPGVTTMLLRTCAGPMEPSTKVCIGMSWFHPNGFEVTGSYFFLYNSFAFVCRLSCALVNSLQLLSMRFTSQASELRKASSKQIALSKVYWRKAETGKSSSSGPNGSARQTEISRRPMKNISTAEKGNMVMYVLKKAAATARINVLNMSTAFMMLKNGNGTGNAKILWISPHALNARTEWEFARL